MTKPITKNSLLDNDNTDGNNTDLEKEPEFPSNDDDEEIDQKCRVCCYYCNQNFQDRY